MAKAQSLLKKMRNNCRCVCVFQCCVSGSIDEEIDIHSAEREPFMRQQSQFYFANYLANVDRQTPNLDEGPHMSETAEIRAAIP
jgi:hypothetical protein